MNQRRLAVFVLMIFGGLPLHAQGNRMSLEAAKEAIQAYQEKLRTEAQIIQIIESRGVDFLSTDENISEISKMGASARIVEAIRKIAPVPTGSIDLRCAPAECDFAINGRPSGKSSGGKFHATGIRIGEAVVDVSREGYVGQQIRVKVTSNPAVVEAVVKLEPTFATKVAIAKRLAEAMFTALGATPGATEITKFAANGALTTYLADKQSEWTFNVEVLNNVTAMRAAATAGTFEFTCTGQTCSQAKSKLFARFKGAKAVPAAISEELQVDLLAYFRYNFVSVLQALLSSSIKFSINGPEGADNEEQHLFADSGDLTYDLTLGPDHRPTSVTYTSDTGLGSGLKITFGQYRPLSNGLQYPMRTAIRLADASKHGIEIRLDKADLAVTPDNTKK